MHKTNRITICRKEFNTQEDFEDSIKTAVMLLIDNNYIVTVRYDEKGLGIVCIDFESDDRKFGGLYPYWLFPEELEQIENFEEERL